MDKLGDVLDELELTSKVGGDDGVETLKAYLEVSLFLSTSLLPSHFIKHGYRIHNLA